MSDDNSFPWFEEEPVQPPSKKELPPEEPPPVPVDGESPAVPPDADHADIRLEGEPDDRLAWLDDGLLTSSADAEAPQGAELAAGEETLQLPPGDEWPTELFSTGDSADPPNSQLEETPWRSAADVSPMSSEVEHPDTHSADAPEGLEFIPADEAAPEQSFGTEPLGALSDDQPSDALDWMAADAPPAASSDVGHPDAQLTDEPEEIEFALAELSSVDETAPEQPFGMETVGTLPDDQPSDALDWMAADAPPAASSDVGHPDAQLTDEPEEIGFAPAELSSVDETAPEQPLGAETVGALPDDQPADALDWMTADAPPVASSDAEHPDAQLTDESEEIGFAPAELSSVDEALPEQAFGMDVVGASPDDQPADALDWMTADAQLTDEPSEFAPAELSSVDETTPEQAFGTETVGALPDDQPADALGWMAADAPPAASSDVGHPDVQLTDEPEEIEFAPAELSSVDETAPEQPFGMETVGTSPDDQPADALDWMAADAPPVASSDVGHPDVQLTDEPEEIEFAPAELSSVDETAPEQPFGMETVGALPDDQPADALDWMTADAPPAASSDVGHPDAQLTDEPEEIEFAPAELSSVDETAPEQPFSMETVGASPDDQPSDALDWMADAPPAASSEAGHPDAQLADEQEEIEFAPAELSPVDDTAPEQPFGMETVALPPGSQAGDAFDWMAADVAPAASSEVGNPAAQLTDEPKGIEFSPVESSAVNKAEPEQPFGMEAVGRPPDDQPSDALDWMAADAPPSQPASADYHDDVPSDGTVQQDNAWTIDSNEPSSPQGTEQVAAVDGNAGEVPWSPIEHETPAFPPSVDDFDEQPASPIAGFGGGSDGDRPPHDDEPFA